MSERPDQWYLDALERKQNDQLFALHVHYWLPKVLAAIGCVLLFIAIVMALS